MQLYKILDLNFITNLVATYSMLNNYPSRSPKSYPIKRSFHVHVRVIFRNQTLFFERFVDRHVSIIIDSRSVLYYLCFYATYDILQLAYFIIYNYLLRTMANLPTLSKSYV